MEATSKWYQRFNRKYVTTEKLRVFHSMRHTLANELKQRGVDGNIIAEILGHSLGSMSLGRYGKGYSPKVVLEALKKRPGICLNYSAEAQMALTVVCRVSDPALCTKAFQPWSIEFP